jgi:hypothetical protein
MPGRRGRGREPGAWTLLASLTCRLLLAPERAWPQLTEAEVEARLPSPALHGAALAGLASGLAALVVYTQPFHGFGSAVRCTLAAVGGSVGATALALSVVPRRLQSAGVSPVRAARYASVVSLPLAAAGAALVLPSLAASLTAIALLGALAFRSGSYGAGAFLGLHRANRTRIALMTALVSALPALLAAPLCTPR